MDYKELINSNPVVVVEFYASWCPHCQKMMPVVDQIKQLLGDRAAVHQFDIDENQSLADATGVESIPTFIIYKNGVEVWKQSGEMEGDVLYSKIENYL
jgi:thioredoxin 1